MVLEEGGKEERERWREGLVQVLGLLDPCYAAVLLQRSRQRCRSRVADVVVDEAARSCIQTKTTFSIQIMFNNA